MKPARLKHGQSRFVRVGKHASDKAQRKLLRNALVESNWNLTRTGISIGLNCPGNVVRAIHKLGLTKLYEAAKASGKIKFSWKGAV